MIKTYSCKHTQQLFELDKSKRFGSIRKQARMKLMAIDAASKLDSLRIPPKNCLEALKGDRKGQHSIRINRQWRVCFVWRDGHAYNVEIVDYH
ncbi:Toxin HigB-1 [Poriferisphaera corsica]|uniref:Toxin HigB-1 n=1 Tax=Poriferisphaera corsica TaxID=2528020 RepID=A0A517YU46_9BACT|nr:type II toxin-antitoxin system RelE/ParE family toxin [Poriferisphaera corsica]QDU33770.1 Toxin HigB-1 [Poriferisphaera corsica]